MYGCRGLIRFTKKLKKKLWQKAVNSETIGKID